MVCPVVRLLAVALAVLAFSQASAVPASVVTLPKDIQDMLEISSKRMSDLVHCTSEKDCKDPSTPRCISYVSPVNGVRYGVCTSRVPEDFYCDDDGDCRGSNLKCMPYSSKCTFSNIKANCCTASGSTPSAGTTSGGSSVTTSGPSVGASGTNNTDNASKDDGCVDERWLTARGYVPGDFVHSSRVVKDVLCPSGLALPCGTQHHAIEFDRKTMSYAELCSGGSSVCTASTMAVNSLWSFHSHSQVGIEIDGRSRDTPVHA
jgi:hypothetical protein